MMENFNTVIPQKESQQPIHDDLRDEDLGRATRLWSARREYMERLEEQLARGAKINDPDQQLRALQLAAAGLDHEEFGDLVYGLQEDKILHVHGESLDHVYKSANPPAEPEEKSETVEDTANVEPEEELTPLEKAALQYLDLRRAGKPYDEAFNVILRDLDPEQARGFAHISRAAENVLQMDEQVSAGVQGPEAFEEIARSLNYRDLELFKRALHIEGWRLEFEEPAASHPDENTDAALEDRTTKMIPVFKKSEQEVHDEIVREMEAENEAAVEHMRRRDHMAQNRQSDTRPYDPLQEAHDDIMREMETANIAAEKELSQRNKTAQERQSDTKPYDGEVEERAVQKDNVVQLESARKQRAEADKVSAALAERVFQAKAISQQVTPEIVAAVDAAVGRPEEVVPRIQEKIQALATSDPERLEEVHQRLEEVRSYEKGPYKDLRMKIAVACQANNIKLRAFHKIVQKDRRSERMRELRRELRSGFGFWKKALNVGTLGLYGFFSSNRKAQRLDATFKSEWDKTQQELTKRKSAFASLFDLLAPQRAAAA